MQQTESAGSKTAPPETAGSGSAEAKSAQPGSTPFWVALFGSIHDVMAAESGLEAQKIACELIPVPRQLSARCGMAVRIAATHGPGLMRLCKDKGLNLEGIYRKNEGVYTLVKKGQPGGR
jgi:hypothetical protein